MQSSVKYSQYLFSETLTRMNDLLASPSNDSQVIDGFDEIQNLEPGEWALARCCVLCVLWHVGRTNSRDIDVKMDIFVYNEVCRILMENKCVMDIIPFCGRVIVLLDTPNKEDMDALLISISKINALCDVVRKGFSSYKGASIEMGIGALYTQAFVMKTESVEKLGKGFIWETPRYVEVTDLAKTALQDSVHALVSEGIYANVKPDYKKFLQEHSVSKLVSTEKIYKTSVYNVRMKEWAN